MRGRQSTFDIPFGVRTRRGIIVRDDYYCIVACHYRRDAVRFDIISSRKHRCEHTAVAPANFTRSPLFSKRLLLNRIRSEAWRDDGTSDGRALFCNSWSGKAARARDKDAFNSFGFFFVNFNTTRGRGASCVSRDEIADDSRRSATS